MPLDRLTRCLVAAVLAALTAACTTTGTGGRSSDASSVHVDRNGDSRSSDGDHPGGTRGYD